MRTAAILRTARHFVVVTFVWSRLLSTAQAQTLAADLAAAEDAYAAIDFTAVRHHAESALGHGGATPDELARLHVLHAIADAAVGDGAQAKQHFIAALALRPDLRLDRELSPKLRAPYLEAQGYWGTYPDRLKLAASTERGSDMVTVELVDPAQLSSELVVRFRRAGAVQYTESVVPNTRTQVTHVGPGLVESGYEYLVQARDRYGNVLAEVGSEASPLRVAGRPREVARRPHSDAPRVASTPAPPRERPASSASYWTPGLLLGAGLGAAGAGGYFHWRREEYAHEWNGTHCELPGSTRGEACGGVDSKRRNAEAWTIGLYAGAAALFTVGIITLVHTSDTPDTGANTVTCGAGFMNVACSGQF